MHSDALCLLACHACHFGRAPGLQFGFARLASAFVSERVLLLACGAQRAVEFLFALRTRQHNRAHVPHKPSTSLSCGRYLCDSRRKNDSWQLLQARATFDPSFDDILLNLGPCIHCTHSLSACSAPGVAAHAVRCSCGRTALFLPRVLLHAHGTPGTQAVPCNCCMCASSLHLWLGKFLFTFSASFTPLQLSFTFTGHHHHHHHHDQ